MILPIERNKSKKVISVILTVCLFAFLGLIFYVNLSCNPEYYDGDIYADINYAKEAWRAKSLFPPNWIFGNQTYVVATPVLAALFYGMIGDAFTAMAAASCVMTVLVVLTYDWMMKPIFSYNRRTAGFLFLVGVLTLKAHVAVSQNGLQAFFTMASYYSCYLITAFVVYGCYIRIRQNKFRRLNIIPAVLGVALSFGTGMQSLRQTAVMTLPLVGCEIILEIYDSVKNKKYTVTKSALFSAVIFAANVAGFYLMKTININQDSIYGGAEFVGSLPEMAKRVFYNIEYIALTFGFDGSGTAVKIVTSVVFIAIILTGFVLCLKKFIKTGEDGEQLILMFLFALGCAGVFGAGVFTNVNNRALYYFMIYPLLAVCVSYLIGNIKKNDAMIYAAVSVFVLVSVIFRFIGTAGEIKTGKDENSVSHQIADYVLNNGYDTVYSVFGLSNSVKGAENVVAASGDRIHLVQFKRMDRTLPMKPVTFLCNKNDFKNRDNAKSLYIFHGDFELKKAKELAKTYGVGMKVLEEFDGDIYICKMSDNLCIYADTQK